jgi:hypothetical protein
MRTVILATAAVVAVGAGAVTPLIIRGPSHEHAGNHEHQAGIKFAASWVYPPTSLPQMVNDADVVALMTAGSTSPGRSVASSSGGSPLEFELVEFVVDDVVKGTPPGRLSVERVASTQLGRPVTISHDGGSFPAGSQHLLFLKKQPEAPYFILLNNEARYEVRQGQLAGAPGGAVSASINGRSVLQGMTLIKQTAGAR